MTARTHDLDLSSVSPKSFEELIYDLLREEGFFNLEWRDGGSDGGRDIVASASETDASGFKEQVRWFSDAKLYGAGIGFDAIHPSLSRATANSPDYLLFAVWPHLTPACKDDLDRWKNLTRPHFKVRVWEKKDIERLLFKHLHILKKYLPSAWSQRLEMDVYLREAAEVLRQFHNRVSIVWKNPDARPFSDILQVTNKKHNAAELIDYSQSLSDNERDFLLALIDAQDHLEKLLAKALNVGETTAFLRVAWDMHPEIRLLAPVPHARILRSDILDGLGRILANFEKSISEGFVRGVITGTSNWKPINNKNRIAAYAIFPKPADPDSEESGGKRPRIEIIAGSS